MSTENKAPSTMLTVDEIDAIRTAWEAGRITVQGAQRFWSALGPKRDKG